MHVLWNLFHWIEQWNEVQHDRTVKCNSVWTLMSQYMFIVEPMEADRDRELLIAKKNYMSSQKEIIWEAHQWFHSHLTWKQKHECVAHVDDQRQQGRCGADIKESRRKKGRLLLQVGFCGNYHNNLTDGAQTEGCLSDLPHTVVGIHYFNPNTKKTCYNHSVTCWKAWRLKQ